LLGAALGQAAIGRFDRLGDHAYRGCHRQRIAGDLPASDHLEGCGCPAIPLAPPRGILRGWLERLRLVSLPRGRGLARHRPGSLGAILSTSPGSPSAALSSVAPTGSATSCSLSASLLSSSANNASRSATGIR